MNDRPQIFTFLDYRAYVSAWVTAAAGRPSLRTLARRAGCSPALLSAVTHGQRNLAPPTAAALAAGMGLEGDEHEYFLRLVAYEQAESRADRAEAFERLVAIRTFRNARRLVDSAWVVFSRWYIPAVAELVHCEGFQADPDWIAAALRPPITPEQASEALDTLVAAGVLVRRDGGGFTRADPLFVSDHEVRGVVSLALVRLHHAMLELAGRALDDLRGPDRHLTTLTFAASPELFADAKAACTRFNELVAGKAAADKGPRDRVVQLSVQLFPLSARTTAARDGD